MNYINEVPIYSETPKAIDLINEAAKCIILGKHILKGSAYTQS